MIGFGYNDDNPHYNQSKSPSRCKRLEESRNGDGVGITEYRIIYRKCAQLVCYPGTLETVALTEKQQRKQPVKTNRGS